MRNILSAVTSRISVVAARKDYRLKRVGPGTRSEQVGVNRDPTLLWKRHTIFSQADSAPGIDRSVSWAM